MSTARHALRVVMALLLLCTVASAQDEAVDALELGQLKWSMSLGYGTAGAENYALPVANSALGRSMAFGRGLQWQLGLNSSVIPLSIHVEHRQAVAVAGRIEVESRHGYARAEDPLQHPTVIRQDVLIPPSQPLALYFAPRVAPPSEPGGLAEVTVSFFRQGSSKPDWTQAISVTQLEPAHVYSLLLDAPPGILQDRINPGNAQQLTLPRNVQEALPEGIFGVLEFDHYLLPCDRGQMTRLPLAARDFVFTVADLGAVRGWPAADQRALVQFVVGGGHLCLYNADGQPWQGLGTLKGAEAGRGIFLPVAGDLPQARQLLREWLSGELEEIVLISGGTARGKATPRMPYDVNYQRQLTLQSAFRSEGIVSHGPGYLHPIWIFRETMRSSALEPFSYPEFTVAYGPRTSQLMRQRGSPTFDNPNLRDVLGQRYRVEMATLADAAQPPHRFPLLPVLAGAVLVGLLSATRSLRVPRLAAAAALLGLAASALLLLGLRSRPLQPAPLELAILDTDNRVQAAARRGLTAGLADAGGSFAIDLPANSTIRNVVWEPAGPWALTLPGAGPATPEQTTGTLRATGGGEYFAVAADAPEPEPFIPGELPVRVRTETDRPGWQTIVIDTSGLQEGEVCWLLTRQGQQQIPAGNPGYRVDVRSSSVPLLPGYGRLLAWHEVFTGAQARESWRFPGEQQGTPGPESWTLSPERTSPFLSHYVRALAGEKSTVALMDLGWVGLMQQPTGLPGLFTTSGVLVFPIGAVGNTGRSSATFVRLTFPLETVQ
jgi:hypothetical protein